MNVIGIVQTDLNEFNILFEEERKHGRGQDGEDQQDDQDNGQDSGQDGGQNDGGDSSGIEDLFGLGGSGQNQNGGQGPQEMMVRIKGVPEGQKATFLQMYQIIQDAKKIRDLEKQLTIVSRGDDNSDQQQGQDKKH
ncbi:hypothetical protein ACI7RC_00815 [Brevibacillus sp. B_LB10_24]|uniref:hypothetical protein n=1 Tax=Brevibacillus sp. B_LB10_24 TaxID=3380645 RepID=UPI0038BA97E1